MKTALWFLLSAGILATSALADDLTHADEHVATATGVYDRLLAQGPIGVVCLILIVIAARIWKDARDDKKEHKLEAKASETAHAAVVKEKDERLLALSLEHARDRATTTILLERIARHLERRESGG